MTVLLTIGIFILTLLLILLRPGGLHEAWATVIGAALMLLTGCATFAQAVAVTARGADVLIFLFALMLLSLLLDRSGFFEWAAIRAARWAKGNGRNLYRNVFVLGALTTALLSLDTTAIILTPIVLSFVRRLKLRPLPFLMACAFVANTGSLLLPVSNLTNLLFQGSFHFSFAAFALRMLVPQVVVLVLNYVFFKYRYKKELPLHFDIETLPQPMEVVPDRGYFNMAVGVMAGVTIGYFAGALLGVQPYVIALSGALVLLGYGLLKKQIGFSLVKSISWSLFPFVAGLFVVIQGVENLGLAGYAARAMVSVQQAPVFVQLLATCFGTALGANIINNIPMALLSISVLTKAHAPDLIRFAALIGCNVGPNLTVAGSLATMLVISTARKKGEDIGAMDFFKTGLWAMPLLLIGTVVALYAVSFLF